MVKNVILLLYFVTETLLLARANPWSVIVSAIILLILSAGLFNKDELKENHELKGKELFLTILLQAVITGYGMIIWGEAATGINEGLPLLRCFLKNMLWMPVFFLITDVLGFFHCVG